MKGKNLMAKDANGKMFLPFVNYLCVLLLISCLFDVVCGIDFCYGKNNRKTKHSHLDIIPISLRKSSKDILFILTKASQKLY